MIFWEYSNEKNIGNQKQYKFPLIKASGNEAVEYNGPRPRPRPSKASGGGGAGSGNCTSGGTKKGSRISCGMDRSSWI